MARPASQSAVAFFLVVAILATVNPAYASGTVSSSGTPSSVAPSSGTLQYYGTGSGSLCYYEQSPVGSSDEAVALATAVGFSTTGFAKIGSGTYDGKQYSWWRGTDSNGQVYSVAQYVCQAGANNFQPSQMCAGMPNARNNPNECCPCGYTYDSAQRMCVLSNTAGCTATCPANSILSGSTCTCNDTYVPDTAKTSCVQAATCSSGYQPDGFGGCMSICTSPWVWNGTSCTCNSPYILVNGSCEIETYELSLEMTTTPIEPSGTAAGNENSTTTIVATVTSQQTKLPKYGAVVEIKMDVDATSGGHDHGEQYAKRPRGELTGTPCIPAQQHLCVTESTGFFFGKAGFTFTAPVVSGKHTFTATCVSPTCSNNPQKIQIDVKVDGLAPIPSSSIYALTESDGSVIGARTGWHTDNHNMTPAAAAALWILASRVLKAGFNQPHSSERQGHYRVNYI